MSPPPRTPSFFEAISAIAKVVEDDPRVGAALSFLDTAAPKTARVVRELVQQAPAAAEGIAQAAAKQLIDEAQELDDSIARRISRAVDEALTNGGARAPKEKRLRSGTKSRAQVAARRARAKT